MPDPKACDVLAVSVCSPVRERLLFRTFLLHIHGGGKVQRTKHSAIETRPRLAQAVEAVADAVRRHGVGALVVDPVLVATSGDSLAGAEVAAAIVERLFPLATVVTPNIPEASVMLGTHCWSTAISLQGQLWCSAAVLGARAGRMPPPAARASLRM